MLLASAIRRSLVGVSSRCISTIEIRGQRYPRDDWSNISPSLVTRLAAPSPLLLPNHPLSILKARIESALPDFASLTTESPVVSVQNNFDQLDFPPDHPGRAKTDSYYINKDVMLQTHTSAHEISTFATGTPKWLLTADVYRRDEIDASHYPVFHQMESARLFSCSTNAMAELAAENAKLEHDLSREALITEDNTRISTENPYQSSQDPRHAELVTANLKHTLNKLIVNLFSLGSGSSKQGPLQIRWIQAYFPFTSPSYEVEVLFRGKWLEILGCGVVKQLTLDRAQRKDEIAWAFGLGLERICMPLFSIPDIRLFWTEDRRFLSQFKEGRITRFRPYSKFPSNYKDISFWQTSHGVHENDICDIVRDVAGDLVEDVKCIDKFTDPKTERVSLCYRVHYRSMDKSLSNDEIGVLQTKIKDRLTNELKVDIR